MFENEKSFVSIITKVASRYRTDLAQSFASQGFSDITPDYWIVLERLWDEDNVTILQLAKRTNKDSASLSRILDGMERNDLVNRVANAADKRSYQVVLTKRSKNIVVKLKEIELSVLQKSAIGLNPIEVKELIRMLNHLFDKLV